MSSAEVTQLESKSSVAITMTARGEATVSVKVYDGVDPSELERLSQLAVETYQDTVAAVREPSSPGHSVRA